MSDTKSERLAASLNEFIQSSPDVEAAAVVSFDGLAMASALPEHMDEDRVGAMSAALLSLGEQAAKGLGRGDMQQLFVEGEHGFVFLMSARNQAVLSAVTDRGAKIGFILFEMRRAAEEIGEVLESRSEEWDARDWAGEQWDPQAQDGAGEQWDDSAETAGTESGADAADHEAQADSVPDQPVVERHSDQGQDSYYIVAGGNGGHSAPLEEWS